MPIVKVWNDNDYPHTEVFKGETITIQPHQAIEMDYIDAVDFRGQFTPMKMRGPNDPDPRFFKKIRVEQPKEAIVKEDNSKHVFHATGKAFESQADMIEFAKAYAKANADLAVRDPDLEQQRGPSNEDLLRRIAALEAELTRKKPGPKPKSAVG